MTEYKCKQCGCSFSSDMLYSQYKVGEIYCPNCGKQEESVEMV